MFKLAAKDTSNFFQEPVDVAADGAPDYISGAILDPETVFQKSTEGVPLPKVLAARGILPGVKPSLTVYKLPGCDGETVMQGLDSLAERRDM